MRILNLGMSIFLSAASAQTKSTGKQRQSLYSVEETSVTVRFQLCDTTRKPVETEDERIGVVVGGKGLHYHWIQAKPYLQIATDS